MCIRDRFSKRQPNHSEDLQRREFNLVNQLNKLTLADYQDDKQLLARIKSYELAYRMQNSLPEAVNLADLQVGQVFETGHSLDSPLTLELSNGDVHQVKLGAQEGMKAIQIVE